MSTNPKTVPSIGGTRNTLNWLFGVLPADPSDAEARECDVWGNPLRSLFAFSTSVRLNDASTTELARLIERVDHLVGELGLFRAELYTAAVTQLHQDAGALDLSIAEDK
jgi:hypothetical protein